ncbi:MAG TPA: hypothetical protein DCE81_11230 [Cytophagales bacterium]|nr:hypothetical protein [Cytophagales bacterium]
MELPINIPFQRLLELVRNLSPAQKSRLKAVLDQEEPQDGKEEFIAFLLKGPVYDKTDLDIIEENRKSIASWRTRG